MNCRISAIAKLFVGINPWAIATVKQIQTAFGDSPEFEDARLGVDKALEILSDRNQSFLLESVAEWLSAGKNVWFAHAAF